MIAALQPAVKTCPQCGATFQPNHPARKVCSPECAAARWQARQDEVAARLRDLPRLAPRPYARSIDAVRAVIPPTIRRMARPVAEYGREGRLAMIRAAARKVYAT